MVAVLSIAPMMREQRAWDETLRPKRCILAHEVEVQGWLELN